MINNQTEEERAWWDKEMRRHNRIIAKGYWRRLRKMVLLGIAATVVIFLVQTWRDVTWVPKRADIVADSLAVDSAINDHSRIPEAITSDTPSAEIQKVYDSERAAVSRPDTFPLKWGRSGDWIVIRHSGDLFDTAIAVEVHTGRRDTAIVESNKGREDKP